MSSNPSHSAAPPTRVAVVGAGFIADFHLEILAGTPGVEVVAVCDPVLHRAEALAKKWKVPHAVASAEELAQHDVRVAHVLVPPDLHARVAREVLEAGVGVLLEKPLALDSETARELGALAAAKDLPLGVNHNAVFHPSFAALLERVRAGEIGRVEHVRVTLSVPLRQLDAGDYSHWMFRAPRNIVFEQAPHPLSQVRELIGTVQSCTTTRLGTRELHPGQVFHDRWLAAAVAERGTLELYLAFGQDFTRSTLEVLGTDGSLEADLFHDQLGGEQKTPWLEFWNSYLAGTRRGGELKRTSRKGLTNYLAATLGLRPRQDAFFVGMRDSVRAFHAALRSGAPLPADADAGAEVLEWCEAVAEGVPGDSPAAAPLAECEPAEARSGEVAVIGGTGFIGTRVVERLLAKGTPVTCIVRRLHSLPAVVADGARAGKVRLVRASLEDPAAMERALAGCTTVMQLATGGGTTWADFERAMVKGSVAVADAAARAGAKRLVFVSSTAALYLGQDAGADTLRDGSPVDPKPALRADYARGKAETETALEAACKANGLELVIARPGVVLGTGTPLQHSGLGLWVRDNHCVGWGAGDNPLPLVLADDVADALVAAALHTGPELAGARLNLCTRVPLSGRQVVEEMRRRTGRALHFHPRSLVLSQTMEIGKWIVKRVGGRRVAFPSYRDLKSRALVPRFEADLSRSVLGWEPIEDPEQFLDRALEGAAPASQEPGAAPSSAAAAPERPSDGEPTAATAGSPTPAPHPDEVPTRR